MRDIKAFLEEAGYYPSEGVAVTNTAKYLLALRPPGKERFGYPAQPFRCEARPLPVAILKQRPKKSKAIASIVLLPDGTAWYRTGGIDLPTREVFASYEIEIRTHIRQPGEDGYAP